MMQKEISFTFYKFVMLQPVCGLQSHIQLKSNVGVKKATLKCLVFLVLHLFFYFETKSTLSLELKK